MSAQTLTSAGKVASPQKGSTSQTRATPAAAPNRALEIQQLVGNRAFSRLVQTKLNFTQAPAGVVQRSPISDAIVFDPTQQPLEVLLDRLSQADVQGAQNDADIDAKIATLLAGRPDDLALAQSIRQARLGTTARGRPVEAHFIRGTTDRRALIIAGVHGNERQGIEIARMLLNDLKTTPPLFTVIVVPSLFPDNAATGTREGATPTNRNFPRVDQDLAAATGSRGPRDARRRRILRENVMLLQLMERFHPERIISIHGTRHSGAGGVFYDPVQPTSTEDAQMRAFARLMAARQFPFAPPSSRFTPLGILALAEAQIYTTLLSNLQHRDRTTALAAAAQIDAATTSITGRESRTMKREGERRVDETELEHRRAHPSVPGNVGPSGNLDVGFFSGSVPGGVSLGQYASQRGISIFTVEPPLNLRTQDYPSSRDPDVDEVERQTELQSYADAVRTVLVGQ